MKPIRLLLLFLCFCPLAVYAQTAEVGGAVQDPSGAVIPKASVEFRNQETGIRRQSTTNSNGLYHLTALDPGKYDATVQAKGFKTLTRENIVFQVGDKSQIDFKMQLGQASENVTVDGSRQEINTVDGSVSTVIDRNFVANIPLNGRSFQDLISLTPGVVTQSPQSASGLGSNGDFSVNGQRTESNTYTVDGVSSNTTSGNGGASVNAGLGGNLSASTALGTTQSLISVDALQEFRVESSTYSAEYGRSPGGQFSFATRSGTSSFHGTLFDYLRNNFFDANDWFNNHYMIAQPALRQNDFGGTFGGPIWIPHLNSSGKHETFFFFSYEGLRLTQPTEAAIQYVPSKSLRLAASNVVQPVLNAFPAPTGAELTVGCDNVSYPCPPAQPVGTQVPSGLATFLQAYSLPGKIDSTSLRVDRMFGSKVHAFVRAGYTPSSTDRRTLSVLYASLSNQQSYAGGLDTQFTSSVNNEFRAGYSRFVAKVGGTVTDFGGNVPTNLAHALGLDGYPNADSEIDLEFSGLPLTSLITLNPANYGQQLNLTDTLSWSMGRHTLRAGVNYLRIGSPYRNNDPYVALVYGSPSSLVNNSADYAFIQRARSASPLYDQFALFAQDEWRISPRLSLSAGLRWEIVPPPQSANSIKPYPLQGDPNNPSTFSLGSPGSQLYSTTWTNIAPRLGMAWKAHSASGRETVIRGGFGIFYDTGNSVTGNVFDSVGTASYIYPTQVPLPVSPAQLDLSFAVTPPYGTVYAVDPHLRLPYTLQWNAALEQALGNRQNLTISYVAASGRSLFKQNILNVGPTNPLFTSVILYQNALTSSYQALQVKFQRQVSHGLQALGSYTWAHSIDFGSIDAGLGYKRGNSDFDLRNNFTAALTWELPHTKGDAISRAVLNEWGLDGRIVARTPFPVNLLGRRFFDPITGSQQASGLNLVSGVPVYVYSPLLPGGRAINSKAFTAPPTNTLGNAPRNFLRGFGETQLNIAVRREFRLIDQARLQFRAEVFNALNHPDFGYIDPTLGDPTFGQATATLANSLGTVSPLYQQGAARSMQFSLKILF